MLIVPREVQEANHIEARKGMTTHFNTCMEKILNENSHREIYWILGKIKAEIVSGKTVLRPFLQASDEKPPLVIDSFVYEVDNTRGVKTLLWVMHPDKTLSFPTLGKTINSEKPKKSKSLILPPK